MCITGETDSMHLFGSTLLCTCCAPLYAPHSWAHLECGCTVAHAPRLTLLGAWAWAPCVLLGANALGRVCPAATRTPVHASSRASHALLRCARCKTRSPWHERPWDVLLGAHTPEYAVLGARPRARSPGRAWLAWMFKFFIAYNILQKYQKKEQYPNKQKYKYYM